MDNKPLSSARFPKRKPTSEHRHIGTEQLSEVSSSNERPKKRTRPIVDASTTCAPEQLHCRYANKKCLNPRAVKRSGGLHTFCSLHRANANRNQRRLDMRKRMARQAMQTQKKKEFIAPIRKAPAMLQPADPTTSVILSSVSPSGEHVDHHLEPLQSPTPLQEEDISTLVSLFLPP
ncbi:unnamed protein product [Hyaloperonospora brassicae]|uniref:SCA7 domain-containing protein n=1 Tax=Hyaloperonospora brassicae TaxID=162125 RepID=A0AAV0TDF5_HYABA|nr:unnamed protein product [Hyaloperonospora brassicae]